MSEKDQEVISTIENGVRILKVNRPRSRNAYDLNVYTTLADTLNSDSDNDQVVFTIITATGDFYSSGFDIKSAVTAGPENVGKHVELIRKVIFAFINYPKLLIALVNGPCIGIGLTTASLCDIIYASDRAYFEAPFVKLGICAEGGSSFNLPQILGRSKASELLLLGLKMSVQEAYQFGLVAKVIPHRELNTFLDQLKKFESSLSMKTVMINKKLIADHHKNILLKCCDTELDQLVKCLESEEHVQAIVKFLNRKSKL